MNAAPSVLALKPGAKLSKADRDALRDAGIIVVRCAPEDLVAIQSVSVLPLSDLLRCALQTINANRNWSGADAIRADFAKRLIDAYVKLDAAASLPSVVQRPDTGAANG